MLANVKDINFSDKGLYELYNDDLITTKINIFKNVLGINKKKCYSEVLFEIFVSSIPNLLNKFFLSCSLKTILFLKFLQISLNSLKPFFVKEI